MQRAYFSHPLRGLIVASMGYTENEAIYMLIAEQCNFLIMYVNEHTCWINFVQI